MGKRLQTPAWLLALGHERPPETIRVEGETLALVRVFKHDFFACTAHYRAPAASRGGIVLKLGRSAPAFGLPLGWVGRLSAWHESNVFRAVDDLDIVPRFTGRHGPRGVTHEFVEGDVLCRGAHVPDDFFDRLGAGLAAMHRRRIAYIDLEKLENVLVGEDGRPYLFDFQISYRWPLRRGAELAPLRWLRSKMARGDYYHLAKLRRRVRPDQMTPEEIAASRRRPRVIRLHGLLMAPFKRLRRRILDRVDPYDGPGERGRMLES